MVKDKKSAEQDDRKVAKETSRRNVVRSKITIVVAVLLLAGSAFAQQRIATQSASSRLPPFSETKGQPEFEPSSFEYSVQGYKYRISGKGRRTRTGGGTATRYFNLRLAKGDSLQRSIYYAEYEGDLVLICEVSDGESGAGFVTRLDGRTLRMKWKRPIPAFNVGPGLIEDNYAYLTAIGFVAKVDLKSGVFVWKHSNLYRDGDFNSFELPAVEGELVLFKEVVIYNEPAKTVKIAKRTGRIVSVH